MRVLLANQRRDRLEGIAQIVAGLGHDVIGRSLEVTRIGPLTAEQRPDVAIVGLGLDSRHSIELIDEIVREALCPVIAFLEAEDPDWIAEAARHGIFGYVTDTRPKALQSAIDIVLQRFAEYHGLQGAFARRATIERAKGVLMERYRCDEERAFALLRDHARRKQRKLHDVAKALLDTHLLSGVPDRKPQPSG